MNRFRKHSVYPSLGRHRARWMMWIAYTGHAAVALGLLLVAITPAWAQAKVETAKVVRRDFLETVNVPGTIEGYYQTDIMSRLEGYVGKVHVDIGDRVEPGDELIELNAPEITAEVRRRDKLVGKAVADMAAGKAEVARAQARAAALAAQQGLRNSELMRIKKLVDSGVLTQAKLDEAQFAYESVLSEMESSQADVQAAEAQLIAAEAGVEVSKADLELAQAMANYLRIRAPFSAVVTQRNIDPGAYVKPPSGMSATPLLQLISMDKMRLVLMLPYASAGKVDVGDPVTFFEIRSLANREFAGTITRHAPAFRKGSRMMRAEVELDNPVNHETNKRALRSGDYGSATITVSNTAIAVPSTAIGNSPAGSYVMQVAAGRALRRSVKVLAQQDGWAVISGPLEVGDLVVANGVDRVKDDQAVITN